MMPEALVCHSTSQRLRLKVASQKGNEPFFSRLRDSFTQYQALERIQVNHLTGSVLFVAERIDIGSIAEYADVNHLFTIRATAPPPIQLLHSVTQPIANLSDKMRRFTGGEADLTILAFLLLMGVGVYQILRGRISAPPWYTAFWYAFGVFSRSLAE